MTARPKPPRPSLERLLQTPPDTPLEGGMLTLWEKELERVHQLWSHERQIWQEQPGAVVIGVDEVGRGPLAGPLVAAAVAFQEPLMHIGINDSKKLSPGERELLFERLKKLDLRYAVAFISHQQIGQGNLHLLSLQALENAVRSLNLTPHMVLVDGRYPLRCQDLPQRPLVGGDRLCASIAAASIMAKVTRDRLMDQLDIQYPGYNFAHNKGYGTPDHLKALQRLGPSPIHRKNFAPVKAFSHEQLQLFKKQRKKTQPPAHP